MRIDDKLSRIATMGPDGEDEDTTGDLIGYLVLLRIARRRARHGAVVDDTFEPWQSAIPEQDVQRREQAARRIFSRADHLEQLNTALATSSRRWRTGTTTRPWCISCST